MSSGIHELGSNVRNIEGKASNANGNEARRVVIDLCLLVCSVQESQGGRSLFTMNISTIRSESVSTFMRLRWRNFVDEWDSGNLR